MAEEIFGMNILVDYHQDDLYYSLYLLLEKRLGHKLYRPIGMDWFEQGYWDIGNPYPNPADTAKQFLGIDDRTWDAYKNLNGDYHIVDGIYRVFNPPHNFHHRAITFEKFKEIQIDIIISSYPFGHDQTYKRLRDTFKPEAKLVSQMGNINQHTDLENVLCSIAPFPSDKNIVFYHQEFDLETYKFKLPKKDSPNLIRSFVNLLPRADLFAEISKMMPEFTFEAYGAGCPNGTISSEKDIARMMQESMFGWHVKPGGDGFGHVIHNWYAVGRPVITSISDYKDKLAGELLTDNITCIDIDGKTPEELVEKIEYFSQWQNHQRMCLNAMSRFEYIVNYEAEAKEIEQFLENLR